ncbi:MAG TPA: hypothetical protein DCY31_04235 [Ruminococcaceae bacterium]|nr:hypothetical protein [Oscillospiraceae bacterium]
MKNKRERIKNALPIAVIAVFVAQIIDVFLIRCDETIFGDVIFARIAGIIITFIAAKKLGIRLKKRCLGRYGWYFELLYGIAFSVAPMLVVYAAELVYFKIKGYYSELYISFYPPNTEDGSLAAELALYIFALLINVFFKEIFRGFLLNGLYEKYGSKKSIYIQGLISTLLSSVLMVGMAVHGVFSERAAVDVAIIVAASLISTFISSVKWGFYYKVNGSIWMAMADHFVNSFVMTCVYLSPDRLPDKWLLVKSLVVQVISCIIFIPFYYRRDRVNAEYAKEMKTRREVLSAMNESTPDLDEKSASDNYMMMMNETNQNRKFGESKNNEILDFDRNPKEYSNSFFENVVDTTVKASSDKKEDSAESSDSISKLVGEYFQKQFDKNTFN